MGKKVRFVGGVSVLMKSAETPEVSVIIPCRDSTQTLGPQLEALTHQVAAPSFEVIIADNGSSDALDAFLEAWMDRLDLRRVDAGRHAGEAFARNVGMAHATAEKQLFCDSDDVVASDWLAEGCAALVRVDVFSGPGHKVRDPALKGGRHSAWALLDRDLAPGGSLKIGAHTDWPILFGANFGMRRSVAIELGGFDAGLSRGIEDNDLAVRVQNSGRRISMARGARILYRERSSIGAIVSAVVRRRRVAHGLGQRHGLWDRSPHLRRWWGLEVLRCVASGARMVVVPAIREWKGLASRFGQGVGMRRGWWRFRVAQRLPVPKTGYGLGSGGRAIHSWNR